MPPTVHRRGTMQPSFFGLNDRIADRLPRQLQSSNRGAELDELARSQRLVMSAAQQPMRLNWIVEATSDADAPSSCCYQNSNPRFLDSALLKSQLVGLNGR